MDVGEGSLFGDVGWSCCEEEEGVLSGVVLLLELELDPAIVSVSILAATSPFSPAVFVFEIVVSDIHRFVHCCDIAAGAGILNGVPFVYSHQHVTNIHQRVWGRLLSLVRDW